MADLDPATLEKFQRFQAMLAASPEIVEALNSPEILALAAKTAAEKKQQEGQQAAPQQPTPTPTPPPPPPPAPEPEYPMVGYGVSDDVSVLSEMTTPTVMTRQTVEEDEFYPEVDGAGKSSSGVPRGVRTIGVVSSNKDGVLPPPPPKPRSNLQRRTTRRAQKSRAMAPMSKIVENNNDNASVVDLDNTSRSTDTKSSDSRSDSRKGKSWSPKMRKEKKIEAHPFFGHVGAGAVSRQARNSTYNNRTRRTKGRGVNRNRSMPTNMKQMGNVSSISGSSDSFWEEDDPSKSSTSELFSTGSNSSTAPGSTATPKTERVKSKASMPEVKRAATRGVARNRSMPMPTKSNSTSSGNSSESPFKLGSLGGQSRSYNDDDDDDDDNETHTRTSISPEDNDEDDKEEEEEKDVEVPLSAENPATPKARDGRGIFSNTPNSRGKSATRMRLVPVVARSVTSAESSPAKMITRSSSAEGLKKPRSRSLSKYSNRSNSSSEFDNSNNDDNQSRASAPANAVFEERNKPRSVKVLRKRSTSSDVKKSRSRSLSKYSNSTRSSGSSDDDDDINNQSFSSMPVGDFSSETRRKPRSARPLRTRSNSSDPKNSRSRSLSKYSSSDDDGEDADNRSRSSMPAGVLSSDERRRPSSSKVLRNNSDSKKPRSRSLSKFSNKNLRGNISSSDDDDDENDNVSRASAPVNASTDTGKVSTARSSSLKKYSYRLNTDEDEDDDGDQPPIPKRVSSGGDNNDSKNHSFSSFLDESDEMNSQISDDDQSHVSSSSSEEPPPQQEEERPKVIRRWKPPSADNSELPPAFRFSSSSHSQKSRDKSAKKSPKILRRKVSSTTSKSSKSSSSEEQKEKQETRTEEQNTASSESDEGEDYVRQTVRKPGKSQSKTPPPAKFDEYLTELNQVIQNDVRPGDYLTGAESSFAATRKKRNSNRSKKNLGKASTAAPRAGDWLGSGVPKKRTWKAKGIKEISSSST